MGSSLSLALKRRLLRDGYVVVPGFFPRALTDPAVRAINHRLGTGEHPGRDYDADKADYLSEYVDAPELMNLSKGRLRDVAESLLGAGKVEPLSHAQVVLRFPAANDDVRYASLLHVDGLYFGKSGLDVRTPKPLRYSFCAGAFLSDVPRPDMGNLTVYPGTHRLLARLVAERGLDAIKGGAAEAIELPPPVQVTGKTGDLVLFHFQLVHDKARNFSPDIRRAAYFRFWHIDAWRDGSRDYLTRAMSDPWLEWSGMRGVNGT